MSSLKRKRIFAALMVVLLALCLFTGCGRKSGTASGGADTGTAAGEANSGSAEEEDNTGAAGEKENGGLVEIVEEDGQEESEPAISEDGTYTSKDDVALYLHTYGHLPDNYITKDEAKDLGWDSKAGNLGEVAPGKSIGGSYFGNYEGNLPEKKGRSYYECDIDYEGGRRNAKRIVYSDDGLIFYTDDHYNTFEQLY